MRRTPPGPAHHGPAAGPAHGPAHGPARDEVDFADDPEEVLSASPFEGDVETALQAAPAGRGRPSSTMLLGVAALMSVAFLGGVQAHEQWGGEQTGGGMGAGGPMAGGYPGGSAQRPGGYGQAGGAPMGGGQAGAGAGGGMTTGTVKLVTGTTVYLQTADGSVVPVETSGSTTIRLSRAGKVTDLKPGATVVVQGDSDDSGKVTASTITEGSGRTTGRTGQGN